MTEHPAVAYAHGWSVRSTVDPAKVPVRIRGQFVWLLENGGLVPCDMLEIAAWIGESA